MDIGTDSVKRGGNASPHSYQTDTDYPATTVRQQLLLLYYGDCCPVEHSIVGVLYCSLTTAYYLRSTEAGALSLSLKKNNCCPTVKQLITAPTVLELARRATYVDFIFRIVVEINSFRF